MMHQMLEKIHNGKNNNLLKNLNIGVMFQMLNQGNLQNFHGQTMNGRDCKKNIVNFFARKCLELFLQEND